MYNCDFFFPSGASLRVRTFVPNVGRGGHNSTLGLTLLEVWARSVQCVAGDKPFELFRPWTHLRQIPGFPQHPRGDWVSASLIPAYARKIWMQTRLFCSRRGYTFLSLFLFAQSTTLRSCRPAAVQPPSSSSLQLLYARVAAVVVADSLIGAWHLSPHHTPSSWCAAASDASQLHVHRSRQFRR